MSIAKLFKSLFDQKLQVCDGSGIVGVCIRYGIDIRGGHQERLKKAVAQELVEGCMCHDNSYPLNCRTFK